MIKGKLSQTVQEENKCLWFHGVRTGSVKLYVSHGILPSNRLKTFGIRDSHMDSRPGRVYVTSDYSLAWDFANRYNEEGITSVSPFCNSCTSCYAARACYVGNRRVILCMGALRIDRRDRNGDRNSVEILGRIRPEYLRIHNYMNSGVCWPLLWVAKERGML